MSSRNSPVPSIADLIDDSSLDQAIEVLRLLSHRERLKVLCVLMHEGEQSVSDLNRVVELGQSALSQHLALLRSAGFVGTRRDGQLIYYSIIRDDVQRLIHLLKDLYCEKQHG